jgi:PKD repeat protein
MPLSRCGVGEIAVKSIRLLASAFAISMAALGGTPAYSLAVSAFSFSPLSPVENQLVQFDGSASSDTNPLLSIILYNWAFGDGATASSASPFTSHIYSAAGDYTASLTVFDNDVPGQTGVFSASIPVGVNETPLPAALPLFASGLGAMGLLARRRKRKQAV